MPNLTSENTLPRGYFWNCDDTVSYEVLNLSQIILPKNTTLYFGVQNNYHFYKLTTLQNYKVSLLRLVAENVCNEDFFRVSKIHSRIRHKGYATTLYLAAIFNSQLNLISDTTLTIPGSYNIWRKLFKIQNELSAFTIMTVDINKKKETELNTKTPITRIYGFDTGLLEIIGDDIENLEVAFEDGDISQELFEFLKDKWEHLEDKKHIRFIARKNTTNF